jgi:hypothetical protein
MRSIPATPHSLTRRVPRRVMRRGRSLTAPPPPPPQLPDPTLWHVPVPELWRIERDIFGVRPAPAAWKGA